MNCNVLYIVSLGLVFNCVVNADGISEGGREKDSSLKNITESVTVDQSKTSKIFSEGNSLINLPSKPSRIKGRKGAIPDSSSDVDLESLNIKPELNGSPPSSTTTTTTIPHINATFETVKSSTASIKVDVSVAKPLTSTTTTTTTTTTTKKPIRKPTITISADDDPRILESEKNINYNVSKIDFTFPPKTSSDTDRTVNEEKQTRRSYVVFMGLIFAVPMTFTLIHVVYKRVKNWLELREYQRVDFLVDGMYIS